MITAKVLQNVLALARGTGFIGFAQDKGINVHQLAEVAADLAAVASHADLLAAQEAKAAKPEAPTE